MILRHVRFTVLITSVTMASVLAQSDAPVRFEVTSVKPGVADAATSFGIRPGGVFWADNVPLALLIGLAHEMNHDYLIVGGPAWIREAKYVVEAKAPAGVTMGPLVTGGKRSPAQQMLAALLSDRFALKAHLETRDLPAFELLTLDDAGTPRANLKPTSPETDCAAMRAKGLLKLPSAPPGPGQVAPCLFLTFPGRVVAGALPIVTLASFLSAQLNRLVIDRTGLGGNFDFEFTWVPETLTASDLGSATEALRGNIAALQPGTSLTTAIREQLGLRLRSTTAPTDVLVIDSVSPPTSN